MAFTAPPDEVVTAPRRGGFTAPDDEVQKGFTAPADEVVDFSKIKGSPVNQPSQFSEGFQLNAQDTAEQAANVFRVAGQVPTLAGNVARAIPADVASTVEGAPQLGGNLYAAAYSQPLPIDAQLSDLSQQSPGSATMGKVSEGLAQSAPLLAVGAGAPAWAQRLIALGFSADMIKGAGDAAKTLGTEMGKNPEDRDQDKITSALSDLSQSVLFAPLTAAHGAGTPIGERFFPQREAVDRLAIALKGKPDYVNLFNNGVQGLPQNMPPAPSGFTAPPDEVVQPTQTAQASANPPQTLTPPPQGMRVDKSTVQAKSPPQDPTAYTPDGQVDPVQTGINKLPQQPTVADVAAQNPDKPVTMGDLAQLAQEMKAAMTFNPAKTADESPGENLAQPSEPTPAEPTATVNSQPEGDATVSPPASEYSPFSDVQFASPSNPTFLHSSDLEQKNPLGLRVAAKAPDGKLIVGNLGDMHFNLQSVPKGSEFGFVDKAGNFLNRDETSKLDSSAKDYDQYQQVTGRVKALLRQGDTNSPEFNALQKEVEIIKNRNDGYPPKPPEPTNPSETPAPAAPVDMITIHRAENPNVKFDDIFDRDKLKEFNSDKPGNSWTDIPDYADYFKESYGKGSVVKSIQIPKSELEKYRVNSSEFKIPSDIEQKYSSLSQPEVEAKNAPAAVEPPATVPGQSEPSGKAGQLANAIADKLESLKSGIGNRRQLHIFGLAADIWDKAVWVAQKVIRAGGNTADAIEAAIQHIKDNFKGTFQEKEARDALQKQLGTDEAKPERERSVEQVKTDTDKAQADLKDATQRGNLPQKDYRTKLNNATAKYRLLRDELLHHPDYIAEQIKAQHDAITEANDILKPTGKTINPDEVTDLTEAREKLPPDQFKRLQDLQEQIAKATGELNQMKPSMVSRVYNEMQADGRMPRPRQFEPNAGRNLDRMSKFLQDNNFDSPKKSFADKLALGQRYLETKAVVKDALTTAFVKAQTAAKAMASLFRSHPAETEYKNVKRSWIGYDTRTAGEQAKYAKELNRKIPDLDRQKAITLWLEAGGDESKLKFQAQNVPEVYRKVFELARKLTPDEKRIAQDIMDGFNEKAGDAEKTGMLEGRAENYVPQRWEKPPAVGEKDPFGESRKGSPGNPYAKLDSRDPFFSFKRETPSYYDGIMAGGKPENLAIGHLVTAYDQAFHKSLGSRGFLRALQDAQAADGKPITILSGDAYKARTGEGSTTFVDSKARPNDAVTADGRPYRSVDHPALRGWKFVTKDDAGNNVFSKGDMLVHPDHFKDIQNELNTPLWMRKLGPGETRSGVETLGHSALQASSFLKSSKFIGPFHVVTEGLHAGTHGAGAILADVMHGDVSGAVKSASGLSPVTRGFEIDFNDPKQALLARNMSLGFGHAREMFEDGVGSHGGIWAKVPGLGDAVVKMNNFTFNDYIPKLKMKVGLAVLDRNMARYSKDTWRGPALNPEQIAEITGKQMDAAFGGQNWRMMGTNKTSLGLARLALVAPDFLISRAKVIGQAFTKYGDEQRYFLVAQALGVYTLSRVLNSIFSDNHDPHFEPRNWDSLVIGKRAYHARFIVSDAAAFARDVFGFGSGQGMPFISGRLGVAPKIGYEALTGRDMFTGRNKQVPGDLHGLARQFEIVMQDTAEWMTPMAVDGFMKGAKNRDQTPLGQIANALVGVSSRPDKPIYQQRSSRR